MKHLLFLGLLLSGILLNAGELEEIQEACNNNDLQKCVELGEAHLLGMYDLKENSNKAIEFYKKACDGNLSTGCGSLASYYKDGFDKNQTKVHEFQLKAIKIATKACDENNARGCAELGWIYKWGSGVTTDDFKAFKLFKKSCEIGDFFGCSLLGDSYFDGKGVRQSYSKANDSFQKSCNLGNPNDNRYACIKLGNSYANGLGIKENHIKALDLYGKACDDGWSEGCEKYAELNKKGK